MTIVELGYGTQSGEVNDRYIAFNTRRTQGEGSLLTTEPLFIQENGREFPTQPRINDDAVHTDRKVKKLTANTCAGYLTHPSNPSVRLRTCCLHPNGIPYYLIFYFLDVG